MIEAKEVDVGVQCEKVVELTKVVQDEQRRMSKRLYKRHIAQTLVLSVFAFNCTKHTEKGIHLEFCAGGGSEEVPGSLQVSIRAVEELLAALKAKLQ